MTATMPRFAELFEKLGRANGWASAIVYAVDPQTDKPNVSVRLFRRGKGVWAIWVDGHFWTSVQSDPLKRCTLTQAKEYVRAQ